jgi:predicted permease
MELNKDLLKKEKKSVFRIILGILFFVFSIGWIVDRIINNQIIRPFDWFYFGIFALNGIVNSIEGFGFSLAKLFGKAFILIDMERIAIKTGVFDKEQNVFWNDMESIESKLNRFQVLKTDGTAHTIDFSKLDYALVQSIKATISGIANEKGLVMR